MSSPSWHMANDCETFPRIYRQGREEACFQSYKISVDKAFNLNLKPLSGGDTAEVER